MTTFRRRYETEPRWRSIVAIGVAACVLIIVASDFVGNALLADVVIVAAAVTFLAGIRFSQIDREDFALRGS